MNAYSYAAKFRREVAGVDERALAALSDAYRVAYDVILRDAHELLGRIAQRSAVGETVSVSAVRRDARFQQLLDQAALAMQGFAQVADATITDAQRTVTQLGQDHGAEFSAAARPQMGVAWNRLPYEALQELIGFSGDGAPLSELLAQLGPATAANIRGALLGGLAAGYNPRKIARQIRDDLNGNLFRAETIARTETLRSYREASRMGYQENDDIVTRWRWSAYHGGRTCAVCLAMDGREFDLPTPLGTHPNCRCALLPVMKSWAELGFTGPGLEEVDYGETGAAWFARQDAATQDGVLGSAKGAAYRAGQMTLDDLVAYRNDRTWGPTRWERSLKEAVAA